MTHPTPDPSTAPCVAPVIGNIQFEAESGTISLRIGARIATWITPAEARALLQVLPGLIKIAEGR